MDGWWFSNTKFLLLLLNCLQKSVFDGKFCIKSIFTRFQNKIKKSFDISSLYKKNHSKYCLCLTSSLLANCFTPLVYRAFCPGHSLEKAFVCNPSCLSLMADVQSHLTRVLSVFQESCSSHLRNIFFSCHLVFVAPNLHI